MGRGRSPCFCVLGRVRSVQCPPSGLGYALTSSVASDMFGILSVVPILYACIFFILVYLTSLIPPVWYLFSDVSGSAYVVGNVSHCNVVLYLTKLLMPQVPLVLHLA